MVKMKDSGLEWIGKIPEDWKSVKFNAIYNLRTEKVSDKDFPPLSVTKKGIVPQLDTAAKTNNGDNRKLVKKGDFAINSRSDRRGSCGISKYDGSVSLINTVLFPRNSKMDPRYYDWLFHTTQFADEFYKWGHGIVDDLWTTNWQDMKHITLILPPLLQQQTIANFLDKKCAEIDRLCAQIQREIDVLEEYRKSIITKAVTKGLNDNVSMKDSGIAWVGKIPKDWKIKPIYTLFKERKNKNDKGKEQNLLSLSYGNVIRKDINKLGGLLPNSFNTYNIVEKNDIIIRPTDLQNDKRSLRTGLVKEHGIITSAYIDLAPLKNTYSAFFHYQLHAYDIEKVFYNMGNGVRQGLNYNEFKKLRLIVPPENLIKVITDYLDKKTSQIDKVVSQKQKQLSILADYKNSLLFEYVTGKKKILSVGED